MSWIAVAAGAVAWVYSLWLYARRARGARSLLETAEQGLDVSRAPAWLSDALLEVRAQSTRESRIVAFNGLVSEVEYQLRQVRTPRVVLRVPFFATMALTLLVSWSDRIVAGALFAIGVCITTLSWLLERLARRWSAQAREHFARHLRRFERDLDGLEPSAEPACHGPSAD